MADLRLIADAFWKGHGALQAAENDIKRLEDRTKTLGLGQGVATEKARLFAQQQRKLSNEVIKGETTFSQAQKNLDEYGQSIGYTGQQMSGTQMKMQRLVAGIGAAAIGFYAAREAARELWSTLKEGAEIDLTRDRFDRLARSIDSTEGALRRGMKDAARGMMTDAGLMRNANELIRLGLAETEEEVVRLSRVISRLGWDMGTVVLTFANNSRLRLDALGLSVQEVEKRMDAFIEQGYSMDKAFDLAVLEAGEAQVGLLGDVADTTSGKITQLETAWGNLVDRMKEGLLLGAAPVLTSFSAAVEKDAKTVDILREAQERRLATDQEVFVSQLRMINANGAASDILEELEARIRYMDATGKSAAETNRIFGDYTELAAMKMYEQADAAAVADVNLNKYLTSAGYATIETRRLGTVAEEAQRRIRLQAEAQQKAWLATSGYGDAAMLAYEVTNKFGQAAESADRALLTYVGIAANATTQTMALATALGFTIDEMNRMIGAAGAYLRKSGDIENTSIKGAVAVGAMKDSIAGLKKPLSEAESGFGGLGSSIETTTEKLERLNRETGSFFMSTRSIESGEFNAMENFLDRLSEAGTGALGLADIGVRSGVFDEDRAGQLLQRTALDQAARQIADLYNAGELTSEEAAARMMELQGNITGNTEAARTLLETLSEDPDAMIIDADGTMALAEADRVVGAIEDMTATLTVDAQWDGTVGGGGGSGSTAGTGSNKPDPDGEAAFGADFIVPPGYPRDTYALGVTTGERVQVTPAGQSGGGGTTVQNFNIYGQTTAAVAMAVVKLYAQGVFAK